MQKIYREDQAKIEANYATRFERAEWNAEVERAKKGRAEINRAAFVPRKASHKQGARA